MLKETNNFNDIIDGVTCKVTKYDHFLYRGNHIKVTGFVGLWNITYYIAIDQDDQILALYNYDRDYLQLKVNPDHYPNKPQEA